MNTISRLIEHFSKFPGIGPRQSRRFVYFLLTRSNGFLEELAKLILELRNAVVMCASCKRFFTPERGAVACAICRDDSRDRSLLMVVEKDVDLENVERSKTFRGSYFVLGGTVPILEKNPESHVRIRDLKKLVEERYAHAPSTDRQGLTEIILAFSLNADGENTARYVAEEIAPAAAKCGARVTHLGRGLSTGSELEYLDPETLRSALLNRIQSTVE